MSQDASLRRMQDMATRFVVVLVLSLAAVAVWARPPLKTPAGAHNVILLMADQHRQDAVGAYGNPVIQTPNLDSIAAKGVRFSQSYTTTPTCTPARSALLTGLGPWNHGLLGYGPIAKSYPYQMPQAMGDGGFYTHVIGKNHFDWNCASNASCVYDSHGYQGEQLYDGWNYYGEQYHKWFAKIAPGKPENPTFLDFNDYRADIYGYPSQMHPTAWVGSLATSFLKEHTADDKPFFLKVSFHRPHSPYDPPQEQWDRYNTTCTDIPKPIESSWETSWNITYTTTPPCRGGDGYDCWCGNMGLEQVADSRRGYYASVSFVDDQIGQILETLKATGLDKTTYVIYTADHGDQLGDHYLWRKGYPLEAAAKVPLMFMWPENDTRFNESKRGSVIDGATVELRDIFPTVLDLGNVSQTGKLDGSSWVELVQKGGKTSNWRDFIDLEHNCVYNDSIHWNALTDGEIKYIFWAQDGSEQLFNLTADPNELTPLQNNPAYLSTLEAWRARMVNHLAGRGAEFVSGGKLIPRPDCMLFSPNYPQSSSEVHGHMNRYDAERLERELGMLDPYSFHSRRR